MPITPERIARIHNFDELLAFLRDDLAWPLAMDATLYEISFAYDRDELRISSATEQKLAGGIVQGLQQMVEDQPCGLFFVRFDQPHLYGVCATRHFAPPGQGQRRAPIL